MQWEQHTKNSLKADKKGNKDNQLLDIDSDDSVSEDEKNDKFDLATDVHHQQEICDLIATMQERKEEQRKILQEHDNIIEIES